MNIINNVDYTHLQFLMNFLIHHPNQWIELIETTQKELDHRKNDLFYHQLEMMKSYSSLKEVAISFLKSENIYTRLFGAEVEIFLRRKNKRKDI